MSRLENSFIFGFGASGGRAAWRLFEKNIQAFFIFGFFLIILSLLLLIALSPLYIIEASINNIFNDFKKYKNYDFGFSFLLPKLRLALSYIILFLSLIVSFLAAPLIYLFYLIILIILSLFSHGDLLENHLGYIFNTSFFVDYISPHNPYLMLNDIYLNNFDGFLMSFYKECLTSFQGNLSLIYFTVALIIGINSLFLNFKVTKKEKYEEQQRKIKINKINEENIIYLKENDIDFNNDIYLLKNHDNYFFLLEFNMNDSNFQLVSEVNKVFFYQNSSDIITIIDVNNSNNSILGIYHEKNFSSKFLSDKKFRNNVKILINNKNQNMFLENGFENFNLSEIKIKDILYKKKISFEIKDITKNYIELYPKGTRGKRMYITFNEFGIIDHFSEIINQKEFLQYLDSISKDDFDLNNLLKQNLKNSMFKEKNDIYITEALNNINKLNTDDEFYFENIDSIILNLKVKQALT